MSSATASRRLRIVFVVPAHYPATAFGGPVWATLELTTRLARRGHEVRVLTTSLTGPGKGRSWRTTIDDVGGVPVERLATPVAYRWMGLTPGVGAALDRGPRPDVVHVGGLRDPIGTLAVRWCRRQDVPYVSEPFGMARPRVRKVALKHVLDRTVLRPVLRDAAVVVASSGRERKEIVAAGAAAASVVVRGNGFPSPDEMPLPTGRLRELASDGGTVVLAVGRVAAGKGLELLLEATARLPDVTVVIAGPDDGHGTEERLAALSQAPALAGRVHRLVPLGRPLDLYGGADVFALPSEGESFGMVAAEAAAAGVPIVVTDRCGVAEFLGDAAIVVPYDAGSFAAAIATLAADPARRRAMSAAGPEVARRHSWDAVALRQEELLLRAADTRPPREGGVQDDEVVHHVRMPGRRTTIEHEEGL